MFEIDPGARGAHRVSPTGCSSVEAILAAGILGDGATGLALILRPDLVMGILGIPLPEPFTHARVIGAFVFSVGLACLVALARPRLRPLVVLQLTVVRVMVGLVALGSVLLGEPKGYGVVAASDLGLAAAQLVWLTIREDEDAS